MAVSTETAQQGAACATDTPGLATHPAGQQASARRALLGLRSSPLIHARAHLWRELLVIAWLGWVYDLITDLAPLRAHTAITNGEDLLVLERSLHLNVELTLNRWLASHHTLGLILSDYYDNAHFVVTLGVLGWLWFRCGQAYRPLRTALVLINLIGFAVFWRYPVAPPRMLTGLGFSDVVASTHAFGSWHAGSLASAANQFAAMPSLHVAWALWSAIALWRVPARLWVRLLVALHPVATVFIVFATGNHFVLDALAGALTCVLALALASALYRALERRPARLGGQRAG
ncbi:MAG TPA: phosphatase PAP2 family protein [Solirubrobacteraceae bacterium]|jgi:hypothetical protein